MSVVDLPTTLHVLVTSSDRRAFSFNVSEEWVRERVVEPWERGEEMVLDGQHWDPRESRITIMEAGEVAGARGLDGWRNFAASGKDRTNDFIRRPAGTAGAPAGDDVGFAKDRRKIMVVHGRNAAARKAMFEFLRAVDLRPLEWTELVGAANAGAPYIGEVLDAAFDEAQAVIVLATPDDLARLRPDLVPEDDRDGEAIVRGQARPNVFLEAGMALGRFPKRTILTELGDLRSPGFRSW